MTWPTARFLLGPNGATWGDSQLVASRGRGLRSAALFGSFCSGVFRYMQGEDLRHTLVTIAISILNAALFLWIFGARCIISTA